jgi:Zn-finger nucleic acid-binding protein
MKTPAKTIQILAFVVLLLSGSNVFAKKKARHKPATEAPAEAPLADSSTVRLKLTDGTNIDADEARETQQGIWYRRGGMNHLIARERVKHIQRAMDKAASTPVVTADNDDAADVPAAKSSTDGPVWIHLVGGARFEADNVNESTAGVWYRRGPLSVFVERARIDHIERELDAVAGNKKARGWTTGNGKIDGWIKQSGTQYGVDPYLIFCVMEQESHFNSRALSPKGARGLMQLMPGTAARFGVRRAGDPAQNIAGGTRYLKQLLGQFNGRIDLVLASYNAGEGAVLKFGRRVPPYRETQNYVRRISYRYGRAKPVTAKRNIVVVGDGQ